MNPSKHIVKVGGAFLRDGRILLVRKRGLALLILPGGKPEEGEDGPATLAREIRKELGCGVATGSIRPIVTFTDRSADGGRRTVTVELLGAELEGEPRPAAEIEQIFWLDRHQLGSAAIAPSLSNLIVPALIEQGLL